MTPSQLVVELEKSLEFFAVQYTRHGQNRDMQATDGCILYTDLVLLLRRYEKENENDA